MCFYFGFAAIFERPFLFRFRLVDSAFLCLYNELTNEVLPVDGCPQVYGLTALTCQATGGFLLPGFQAQSNDRNYHKSDIDNNIQELIISHTITSILLERGNGGQPPSVGGNTSNRS